MKSPSNKKHCYFCATNIKLIDYKETQTLKKFLAPQAQIMRRKKTGVCALHQRKFARAVKRARQLGLLPFISR